MQTQQKIHLSLNAGVSSAHHVWLFFTRRSHGAIEERFRNRSYWGRDSAGETQHCH